MQFEAQLQVTQVRLPVCVFALSAGYAESLLASTSALCAQPSAPFSSLLFPLFSSCLPCLVAKRSNGTSQSPCPQCVYWLPTGQSGAAAAHF